MLKVCAERDIIELQLVMRNEKCDSSMSNE